MASNERSLADFAGEEDVDDGLGPDPDHITEDCPGIEAAIDRGVLPCWKCWREAPEEQFRRLLEAHADRVGDRFGRTDRFETDS